MKKKMRTLFSFLQALVIPGIAIGGLFFPFLGYLAGGYALIMMGLSIRKKRHGCRNICPRAHFLDFLRVYSLGKRQPRLFKKNSFRYLVLVLFLALVTYRISYTDGVLEAGSVMVSMCIISTLIAISLGIIMKPRSWCAVCPVGTMQDISNKVTRYRPLSTILSSIY